MDGILLGCKSVTHNAKIYEHRYGFKRFLKNIGVNDVAKTKPIAFHCIYCGECVHIWKKIHNKKIENDYGKNVVITFFY